MAFQDDYSNLYNQASSMMYVPTPYFETPEQEMMRIFGTTDPMSVLSMMMSDASYRASQNQPVTGLGIDGFNTSNIGLSSGGGEGSSSSGGSTSEDGSLASYLAKGAQWVGDKLIDNAGKVVGTLAGFGLAGPSGAAIGGKIGDNIQNAFEGSSSSEGTTATGTELSKMMTETNPYGTANFGDNTIKSSIVPDVNISQPGYDNLSLTPGLSISPVGDIAQNFSNSLGVSDVYNMTSPDGKNYIYSPDLGIDGSQTTPTNTISATDNLPAINAETVDFGLNKNPITGDLINANTGGGTVNPGGTTSPYIIPSTTDTIGGGINPNGGGITPTITGGGGVTPIVTPTTPTTPTIPISGPAVGELPQFRKQLNRALGEAKNAAIMRGRPLTEDDISGAVAGLAEGAYGRLRGAQSEQNDKERLQILKDQVATSKEQWEKGFISDNEYRNKVLELEKYYADKGLEIDMDLIDQNNDNAQTGNLIGAGYLLADLFWG